MARKRYKTEYRETVRDVERVVYVPGPPVVIVRDHYTPSTPTRVGPRRWQGVVRQKVPVRVPAGRRIAGPVNLRFKPQPDRGFGRKYLRFLFDKASGGAGRRHRWKKFLCGR